MKFGIVTANITGAVRHDTMEGRDYLVAPMIMLVEGVHEGSGGKLYYPKEELAKTPAVWNHKPVVVYHPQFNGIPVSACDPDILTNRKVGVIMNTRFEDGKLKSEAWLEKDRMNKVDERIANAIETETMMELSTGLFSDNENMQGKWGEEDYDAIARNYRPDHLALLPDLKGACSIADGAGLIRVNEAKEKFIIDMEKLGDKERQYVLSGKANIVNRINTNIAALLDNEMSHSDLRSLLNSLLRMNNDKLWIDEVYDNYFIYEDDGQLYKQEYKVTDGSVSFVPTKEQVVRVVEYKIKANIFNEKRKGCTMKIKEIVDALIKNETTQWKEEDREALEVMDEAVLNKMIPIEKKEPEKKEPEKKEESVANTEAKKTEEKTEPEKKPTANMTAEEYISNVVPDELKGSLRNGLNSYNANKAKLVGIITANERNTFTKEQLEKKDLEELQALAALAVDTKKKQEDIQALNFSGQGDPVINGNKQKPLSVPVMNFDKKD